MHFTGLVCTKFSDKTKNAKSAKFKGARWYLKPFKLNHMLLLHHNYTITHTWSIQDYMPVFSQRTWTRNPRGPVNLIDEISKYLLWKYIFPHFYTFRNKFHLSRNISYISDLSSKTFNTSTAARKAICWLRNDGQMVFEQKCLVQLR